MNLNRELLEKQFTGKEIKTRKGNFGSMIDYVDVQLIIQRLNDAFDSKWDFDVIEHEIKETEVIVLGKLCAEGVHKYQFGSNKITVSKAGDVISIGDDLKAATSDSLKKCASMFGVALHIYGDSLLDQPEEKKSKHNPSATPKTEPVSTATDEEARAQEELEKNIPTEAQKIEKYRESFFSQPKISAMDDEEKKAWCLKFIGTHSTKQFTLHDWVRASELARIQNTRLNFNVTDEKPTPPQDEKRLQRMSKAYFASLPERLMDDAIRHQWQRDNIKKASTKDWTEVEFEKALDMINILNKEIAEKDNPDVKKELPKIDPGLRGTNGGSVKASDAQLKFIQNLFERKGYFTQEDMQSWNKGKAICVIELLQKQ